ncbi:hypothetical protein IH970_02050 [candidate division KSB1 bacterium]|nr:hypothetical protein [candidate division KSB1 bacterium]
MGKAALLVVLGTSLVLGNMLVGLNKRANSQNEFISEHYERMISRNIANSAANIAVSKLFQDFSWRTGIASTGMAGGYYAADIQDINFDTTVAVQRVKVTATSTYGGVTDTVIAVVARPPSSYYAQFTDNWPTANSYVTGDTLYGPIHTNTKFKFGGSPVFFGKVSSVDPGYDTWGSGAPQFLGGTEFGANAIPMPSLATGLQALEDSADAGGDVYSANHVWLKFFPDGSYDWYEGPSFSGTYAGTKFLSDITGVIMLDKNNKDIHVQGTVSGQVTIYGKGGHIYIDDDIVYADDPRINPDSQDMLGLVATKDIIVADTPANRDELPNNIEIHGAIMALNQKFKVENLEGAGLLGTMTLFGSTFQKQRGKLANGSLDSNFNVTITDGYALKSYYDNRFLHVGPPVFPTAQKTVVYSWLEDTRYRQNHGVNVGSAGGVGVGGYQTGAGEVN